MEPFSHENATLAGIESSRLRGKLRKLVTHSPQKGNLDSSMPDHPRLLAMKSKRKGTRMLIVMLCALTILAGCGNGSTTDTDEEGHQFATERRPTAVSTATVDSTPVAGVIPPTAEPTTDPSDALNVRGAPQFAYFLIDDGLQVYDTVARTFTAIDIPDDMSILDFASSPTGDRIGVLGLIDDGVVVQFYGADGASLGDPTNLAIAYAPLQVSPVASPVATPMTASAPLTLYVTWVPQGNAVVVSGPGVMQRVSMNGAIMPISRTGATGTVVKALWSPMDSQVAILTQLMDGHQGVFMLDSGHAEAQEQEQLHMQPGQSLSNLQWLPNGLGLVLVAGNKSDGELMNGQLYVYEFGEPVPNLVATSGQGGPAGTISHAVVSPDGHSVAYAIMVRDQNDWHLHSLWVRPLKGGGGLSIPLESNAPITTIVWTAEGLVWQQADGSLTVIDESFTPGPLGQEPIATPIASPESTPVVDATPRG